MRLVLASASPRRAELLNAAGFTFEILAVDIDEAVAPGEAADAYVRRLALEKSARAQATLSTAQLDLLKPSGAVGRVGLHDEEPSDPTRLVVLGADTSVVVDGEILGKPRNRGDGDRMLRLLSGRRHHVVTGFSLRSNEIELGGVETTAVDFLDLSEIDLNWYAASGEGADKAGGYAIQGLGSRFVTRVDGSYSNVVGLPIASVFTLLRHLASAG